MSYYPPGSVPWSETAAGTDSGATATHAAGAAGIDSTHFITGCSGHVDEDQTIQLRDGSTVMAEFKIDFSVEGLQFHPWTGCIPITPGNACSAVLAGSASDCQVNFNGYSMP
jgi:hypothetical protein